MIPRHAKSHFVPQHTIGQPQVGLTTMHPVRAQLLNQTEDVFPHDHAYHEICVVLGGSATHQTADGESTIKRGCVIVVPPGKVHAFFKASSLRVANVYYLAEWFAAELGLLWQHPGLVPMFLSGTLFPATTVHECIASNIDRLEHDLIDLHGESERHDHSPVFVRATLLKVMATITRDAAATEDERQLGFRPNVWAAIREIERVVEHGESLSLPALADVAALSPDHFSRVFRAATGRGVLDYFQRRRVLRAGLLLLDPRHSITEVAHRLGYADGPHLSRMFKRYQGVTPNHYRQTHSGPS